MHIDEIIRSKRKTIALIVERDGRVLVRAPQRATEAQIQQFVKEKTGWIRAKQAQIAANPPLPPRQFVDGELFYYLGVRYPLRVVQRQQGKLCFTGEAFYLRKAEQIRAKERFVDWYRREARKVIAERLNLYAPVGQFEYQHVRITGAKTRWGSRGAGGALNFTWRLVMAPLEAVDYVVVHELAHLKVPGHQGEFWKLVASLMPDYKVRQRWLKENGHLLVL